MTLKAICFARCAEHCILHTEIPKHLQLWIHYCIESSASPQDKSTQRSPGVKLCHYIGRIPLAYATFLSFIHLDSLGVHVHRLARLCGCGIERFPAVDYILIACDIKSSWIPRTSWPIRWPREWYHRGMVRPPGYHLVPAQWSTILLLAPRAPYENEIRYRSWKSSDRPLCILA